VRCPAKGQGYGGQDVNVMGGPRIPDHAGKGEKMKKKDVEIGRKYMAKVSRQMTVVKILDESPYGGWRARNVLTGREVRVKSAARLRYPVR